MRPRPASGPLQTERAEATIEGVYCLTPPRAERLARLLEEQRERDLTYPEVGATLSGRLPDGYHHRRETVGLGRGAADFRRGVEALRRWRAHLGSGARVFPLDAPLQPGTVVVVSARVAVLYVLAACRVVDVVEDTSRFGFAYGTLPAHPEQGEEAFVLERGPDDVVRFTVTAFFRARHVLVRAAGPAAPVLQRRATLAYLRAMREAVGTAVGTRDERETDQ